jgi:integrase
MDSGDVLICNFLKEIMEQLYDYNHLPEYWDICDDQPYTGIPDKHSIHNWGGPLTRRAAQAIYTVMFLCLLRVDEVLKIRMEHVVFEDRKVILTLPFRKTHQFGGKLLYFELIIFIWLTSSIEIKPFVLHLLPEEEAYLCPVRALADWISASGITHGYLFRRMAARDRPSARDSPMASTDTLTIYYTHISILQTSEQCLEIFRHNLLDISIHPAPYGTHSFRRGGCQWLASVRRWKLRRICDWGGWSTEFSSLTIVKYLISWNDDPTETRDNFFNPEQAPSLLCYHCGRSCSCA